MDAASTTPGELDSEIEAPVEMHAPRPMALPVVAALATAILFDVCIYRGGGYAGWSLFFCAAIATFLLGTWSRRPHASRWIICLMLLLAAARLFWLGSVPLVLLGLLLLPPLAMTGRGLTPYVFDALFYAFQSLFAGGLGLSRSLADWQDRRVSVPRVNWLSFLLPLAAVCMFGTIFVLANPDIATWTSRWLGDLGQWLERVTRRIDLTPIDFIVVGAMTWLALGLFVPLMTESLQDWSSGQVVQNEDQSRKPSPLYGPFRNTLLSVIVLFTLYLGFEFRTLWFREFPEGFYYAGYAHQGAAWLTLALALATFMLSAIFRGRLLRDPRVGSLQRLAWLWSAANFLLAIAVYNRLFIYIAFNGMTRMRVVGLFGISTVVVGFLLVMLKIHHGHRFLWLIQRHLWTLSLALYLLAITPVDFLVHSYNVRQILAGRLAPSVQITEHPVDASGWLALRSLVDCEDEIIREGIRARLADFYFRDESPPKYRVERGRWSHFQLADHQLRAALAATPEMWRPYADQSKREELWKRFREHAYQWY